MVLPFPFPDELLFGRFIRSVTLSGESGGAFENKLLGSSRTSIHPFLTSGLYYLVNTAGEDSEKLLWEQTLAPLFLFFLPVHAERLKMFLLHNEGEKAFRESQLPSFHGGHSLCLKWCPVCANEDMFEYGVSYWHCSHQIPGVTACFRHPVSLERINLDRRQRVVPGLLPMCGLSSRPATEIESNVSMFSHDLLNILQQDFVSLELATIYRNRLNEFGFMTAAGRIRRKCLLQRFVAGVKDYRSSPDSPLPRNQNDYRYLSELLETNGSHHPFRHLLFGTWLFNRAEKLLNYRPERKKALAYKSTNNHGIEQRCLILLREGRSLAEVYRLTGKSRCYLKRLAVQHGVPLVLKPKQLTYELQQRIIRLARLGIHRGVISKRCGIGIGSVEQVISSEPGLVAWRKRCHWESKRRRYRLCIALYQQRHFDAIRRDVKAECNAAYFWLYQHDRDWLESELPQASKPIGFGQYEV